MRTYEKLFTKLFTKKNVLDDDEFYRRVHFISKEISQDILKDMEELGFVKIKKNYNVKRIYNSRKLL